MDSLQLATLPYLAQNQKGALKKGGLPWPHRFRRVKMSQEICKPWPNCCWCRRKISDADAEFLRWRPSPYSILSARTMLRRSGPWPMQKKTQNKSGQRATVISMPLLVGDFGLGWSGKFSVKGIGYLFAYIVSKSTLVRRAKPKLRFNFHCSCKSLSALAGCQDRRVISPSRRTFRRLD